MITDYGVNIQVMLQENPSGGASRRVMGSRLIITICAFFLIIIQGCTIQSPKLNTHFLPTKYVIKTSDQEHALQTKNQFNAILINENKDLNSLIVRFWKSGSFKNVLAWEHPYLKINRTHIEAVEAGLNRLFTIYYISGNSNRRPGMAILFRPEDYSNDCQPLSNHEIQFMLNKNAESAFSTVAFTMMIISSHELVLQNGGEPIYPKVLSPFLRKRYNLSELKKLQDYNLFATKHSGRFKPSKSQGFVFCRKVNQ